MPSVTILPSAFTTIDEPSENVIVKFGVNASPVYVWFSAVIVVSLMSIGSTSSASSLIW